MNATTTTRPVKLPRDTTRQSQDLLYGDLARRINRWTGIVILVFVIIHLPAQAVMHVGALASLRDAMPWLVPIQNIPLVHAVLFASLAFHTLYGLKLIAVELGLRIDYRLSFWAISVISGCFALRELLRYVGV